MKKQLRYVRIGLDFAQEKINCASEECKELPVKVYFLVRNNDNQLVFLCKKHGLKDVKRLEEYNFVYSNQFQYHPDNCKCGIPLFHDRPPKVEKLCRVCELPLMEHIVSSLADYSEWMGTHHKSKGCETACLSWKIDKPFGEIFKELSK